MKPWQVLLTGWLTFLLGHSMNVAVRTRALATYFDNFAANRAQGNSPPSEFLFLVIDGAIVAAAMAMVITGTLRMLSQSRWRLLIAPPALVLQLALGLYLYLILTVFVHIRLGGPI